MEGVRLTAVAQDDAADSIWQIDQINREPVAEWRVENAAHLVLYDPSANPDFLIGRRIIPPDSENVKID